MNSYGAWEIDQGWAVLDALEAHKYGRRSYFRDTNLPRFDGVACRHEEWIIDTTNGDHVCTDCGRIIRRIIASPQWITNPIILGGYHPFEYRCDPPVPVTGDTYRPQTYMREKMSQWTSACPKVPDCDLRRIRLEARNYCARHGKVYTDLRKDDVREILRPLNTPDFSWTKHYLEKYMYILSALDASFYRPVEVAERVCGMFPNILQMWIRYKKGSKRSFPCYNQAIRNMLELLHVNDTGLAKRFDLMRYRDDFPPPKTISKQLRAFWEYVAEKNLFTYKFKPL